MWLDRAIKWLLPRESHFFDFLDGLAERALVSGLCYRGLRLLLGT